MKSKHWFTTSTINYSTYSSSRSLTSHRKLLYAGPSTTASQSLGVPLFLKHKQVRAKVTVFKETLHWPIFYGSMTLRIQVCKSGITRKFQTAFSYRPLSLSFSHSLLFSLVFTLSVNYVAFPPSFTD